MARHLNTVQMTSLHSNVVSEMVKRSLDEDLGLAVRGDGQTNGATKAFGIPGDDVTASLVPPTTRAKATVITRGPIVVCGRAFVDEVFRQVDSSASIQWFCKDGDQVAANEKLFDVEGDARAVLTAERSALNFLQLLSGTATTTRQYADAIAHTKCRVLDTRKTVPGLRAAQKHAVSCGGGCNHRIGLYDAFLIKENHIAACGGIAAAARAAREKTKAAGKEGLILVEIEVENLSQLEEVLSLDSDCPVDVVMLDNFSHEDMHAAVERVRKAAESGKAVPQLEASGNVTLETIASVAETGVDYVSIGALTKHVSAADLSMRITWTDL
eukprot:TRINITY_DN104829_c0_g1_i1.p1 TRINITY_DN104829_c0_g1~~TRINITY_DN104829_c0_g1_i1.p1  ORF type:complete len:365 (-),score=61.41 TRINITY_DN104829_c0_g1_i1:61-1041(-)